MAGQPLNATFFALRKREKSGVLTAATVAYLVLALIIFAAFIGVNYQAIGAVATWYIQIVSAAAGGAQPNIDPNSLPPGLATFFLSLIPFMFLGYLAFAAYEAACLRWLVRGETGGLMGLSLGADTWRVYAGYWVWFALYMAFSIVFTILTGAAMGAGIMAGGNMDPTVAMAAPMALITLLRVVLMIYFGVRLAPAAATSVGKRKFAFFDAWTVTKGRFWALFGAFLLVFLIFFAVEIVLIGVVFAVVGFSAFQLGSSAAPEQLMATLLTPQNLIIVGAAYLLLLLVGFLVYLMMFGINARAVIAAAEDGKIDGVNVANLAHAFE